MKYKCSRALFMFQSCKNTFQNFTAVQNCTAAYQKPSFYLKCSKIRLLFFNVIRLHSKIMLSLKIVSYTYHFSFLTFSKTRLLFWLPDASKLLWFQEAHVYKYADRSQLFYQCQISISIKVSKRAGFELNFSRLRNVEKQWRNLTIELWKGDCWPASLLSKNEFCHRFWNF